jgi:hypothetical protein
MADLRSKPPHRRIWDWMRHNEDTAFAVIMAGIAALFIIGIVSAFNYAATTNTADSAPAATRTRAPAETTGAGGSRPRPPQHDPREDEQMERSR